MALLDAIGRAFSAVMNRGDSRVTLIEKHDRVADQFGVGPKQIASAMKGALGGEWDSFHTVVAMFKNYLLKDLHLRAEYEKRREAICKWPWNVSTPYDADARLDAAAAIESDLADIDDFEDMLHALTDAVGVGFSAVELIGVYDKSAGRIRVQSWSGVPQWALRKTREGLWEFKGERDWTPVPAGKLLVWERPMDGSPLIGGLMWPAVWFALFKTFSVGDWMSFLETYGQPLRLGKYPPHIAADSPEARVLRRAVIDLARSAGAIVPSGMEIDIKEASKSGTTDAYKVFLEYMDQGISELFVGGNLLSDSGEKGARSLGEVQLEQLDDKGARDARSLWGAINRGLIRPLVAANYGEQETYPKAAPVTLTVSKQTKRMAVLQGAFNMRVPLATRQIYEDLGIDPPAEGDEIVVNTGMNAVDVSGEAGALQTAASLAPRGTLTPAPSPVKRARGVTVAEMSRALPREFAEAQDFIDGMAERLIYRFSDIYTAAITRAAMNPEQEADAAREFRADFVDALAPVMAAGAWAGTWWVWSEARAKLADPAALRLEDMIARVTAELGAQPGLRRAEAASAAQAGAAVPHGGADAPQPLTTAELFARSTFAIRGIEPKATGMSPRSVAEAGGGGAHPAAPVPQFAIGERGSVTVAALVEFSKKMDSMEWAKRKDGSIRWSAVAPEDAMKWWADRVGVVQAQFDAMQESARAYAFTISGVESKAVIDTAHAAIADALKEGGTLDSVEKSIKAAIKKAGYDSFSPWALRTIAHQNVMTATAAGRVVSQRSPEVMKYLPYLTRHSVMDGRERPEHHDLHGLTRLASDPVWNTRYTPDGWGCRCWITSETEPPPGSFSEPAVWPAVEKGFEETNPATFWKRMATTE